MKKSAVKLTDTMVLGLKPATSKFCVWDSACPGFGVEVTPAGAKLMVAKTSVDGHRAWHSLGRYGVSGEEWTDAATGQIKTRRWNVEDFRLRAQIIKDQARKGEDPRATVAARKAALKAQRQRPTINQLADRFIKDHIRAEVVPNEDGRLVISKIGPEGTGNRLSTAKEHIRLIDKFIRPSLGQSPVEDVGSAEIAAMLRKIQDETPIQANRVRAVLSKMFSRAEMWEFRPLGTNPVRVQDRVPESKRERNLTDAEIRALGQALATAEGLEPRVDLPKRATKTQKKAPNSSGKAPQKPAKAITDLSPHTLAAIRLALLTGMRKGELLALKWEWVDLEHRVIRIPPESHKTGGKTGKDRVILLCEAASKLLQQLSQKLGNPYVIVGRGSGPLVNLQDPWEVVREAAGLDAFKVWLKDNAKAWKQATPHQKREIEKKLDEKQVHFHDLRRTFASVATRMGYPELWIGALLGHAAGSVTAGYARADMNDDPLREALEAIGKRMAGLLDGTLDPNVKPVDVEKRSIS